MPRANHSDATGSACGMPGIEDHSFGAGAPQLPFGGTRGSGYGNKARRGAR